jgi:tetratricopeptide (TPR) repeat protein
LQGSAERLRAAIDRYAGTPIGGVLSEALVALAGADYGRTIQRARQALALDPACPPAFRLLALGLEAQGHIIEALEAHQATFALQGESPDLLEDLGRLSMELGQHDAAAQMFARALATQPSAPHLATQLARALSGGHAYDEAIHVLRGAIEADVGNAHLWNALGAVVLQQGEADNALIFFEHALTLAPDLIEPLYNRANAKLDRGDLAGALADGDAALARAAPDQQPTILFVRALTRLTLGDLEGGWADYEARLDLDFPKAPIFDIPLPRWAPGQDLKGRRLLIVAEQGLGDEIMFAGMIPDAIEALGPTGTLCLAVEPRLVALFQRSFPGAVVRPHGTARAEGRPVRTAPFTADEADLWTPMASLAQQFRTTLADFQAPGGYLAPDPARVDYWRRALGEDDPRPKVGLVWKSMKTGGDRKKQYAPFEAWAPVLGTPGVRFVNLQYGDCAAELEAARVLGVDVWSAPNLDLTHNIDEAAALSAALDLLLGVGNASTNLAGACGVPVWLSLPPAAWPRLGAQTYPWFAGSRVFVAQRFGEWDPVMTALAQALGERFGAG